MEKYRAYSHGRKNVVKVGVERYWQFYRETGLNDFFFDILALKKIKTIYTIYVELIFQSLENLADFRPFFLVQFSSSFHWNAESSIMRQIANQNFDWTSMWTDDGKISYTCQRTQTQKIIMIIRM